MPNNYSEGLFVVFIISVAKLFNSVLGNNNSILFYSDYYRMVLFFGVIIAICTVVMNLVFIPAFGLEGAALASCITIFIYNSIKLWFVWLKFKISPFTKQTGQTISVIVLLLIAFYFWDVIEYPFLSIVIKTALCSLFYAYLVFKFKLSTDIYFIMNQWLLKIKSPLNRG